MLRPLLFLEFCEGDWVVEFIIIWSVEIMAVISLRSERKQLNPDIRESLVVFPLSIRNEPLGQVIDRRIVAFLIPGLFQDPLDVGGLKVAQRLRGCRHGGEDAVENIRLFLEVLEDRKSVG